MNKISWSPTLREPSRLPAQKQTEPPGPVDTFTQNHTDPVVGKPSFDPAPKPGKVSWFHRGTGAALGVLVGCGVSLAVASGPVAVAVGAVAGMVAGALAAGTSHSTSQHTAKLHQLTAGAAGLMGGSVAGLGVGDLLYHANSIFASQGHVGGALIGAAAGAIALAMAARFFPDKPA